MPLIWCETTPLGNKQFDLTQTVYIGASIEAERALEWYAEDRLLAAIINIGLACKWLTEDYIISPNKWVAIQTDEDGKDKRYGGEHNILFNLLCPTDDFQARKARSLYYQYEAYLGRIKQLTMRHNIDIRLGRGSYAGY